MKGAIARFLKKHAHEADVQLSQCVIAARAALKTPLHDLSRIVSKESWKDYNKYLESMAETIDCSSFRDKPKEAW
eukprot:890889-Karenia_brevis.AAC.1